jgi:hypothetical protein
MTYLDIPMAVAGHAYTAVVEFETLPLNIDRTYSTHQTVLEAKEWVELRRSERPEAFLRGDVIANGLGGGVVASCFEGEWN